MTGQEPNDSDLLRHYAEARSDDAFARIVNRHLPLVFSAALRLTSGNTHQAQDITQSVFTELALRASRLARHPSLAGWLHTTTHHLACRSIRGDSRRAARELKAHAMHDLQRDPAPDWSRIRPVLDDALQDLREADRHAVLLRFLESRNLRAVGETLGVSEDAARMRIDRALERLRKALGKRGITTTAAALSLSLGAHGIELLPAGLATQVTALATTTAATAATTAGSAYLASGWLAKLPAPLLAMKTPIVITAITSALIAIPLVIQQHRLHATQTELDRARNLASGLDAARADSEEQERQRGLSGTIQNLRDATADLPRLRSEVAQLRASPTRPLQSQLAREESAAAAAEASRTEAQTETEFRETQLLRINSLKFLGLATRLHANDHGDQIPARIEDITNIFATLKPPGQAPAASPDSSAEPTDLFEFFPQPRPISFREPGLFLYREKQPRQDTKGVWWRAYTMVDGSVQNLHSDTADFTKAENDFGGIAQPLPEPAR